MSLRSKYSTGKGTSMKTAQPKTGQRWPTGKFKADSLQNVNIAATDPKKEQFAPTDGEPVRQRFKMGGGC